ncbi:MAG: hypothetical protein NTV93_15240 [Verrucomicrobia bacterium]|nr:hypothetical protein [Verrucomicrobiota bacterium]
MAREPETYCDDAIFKTGIGQVVVCRYKSGGRVETGSFLVDVYCLGVKDAFFRVFEEGEFREDCLARYFPDGLPAPKPASWGRKLVEEAVRYAASLGFAPHSDYKKGARVFGGVDAIRLLQALWNLRALPVEDRAEALRAMPADMAGLLREAVEQADEADPADQRLMLDFLLLNADVPGKERLLCLAESF